MNGTQPPVGSADKVRSQADAAGPADDGLSPLSTDGPAAAMAQDSLAATFVRRPVLAFVLNTLIVVAGLAAYFGVEIRELPEVDRPVISVRTEFEGASPETIDREVTAVIEGAVARVSGVRSISSSSSFGRSSVTIEFDDDTDLSVAAADARDSISRVSNDLPDLADEPRIIKADANAQPVMRLAVTSPSLSVEDLTVLVEDEVVDRLAAVPGVADVQVYGDRDKIFRIDIEPIKLAGRGLTVADLRNALSSIAFDVPAGSLTSTDQDLAVRATADVVTPDDFEKLFIADNVRIGDVATVTMGPDIGQTSLRANGQTGIGMGIVRQAQSNTLDISRGVRAAAMEIQDILPKGVTVRVTSDDAVFIRGAIKEVLQSLSLAALAVVIIIYIFLLDIRATLIPAVTMPVALIGTVAAIYLAGFSINILTLLAIVLATGMVVDDAIVVLENIVRRRGEGLGARAAAVLGAQEVFFAVITTTATLVAVFVPLSFLPGQAGGLFREFGFVLAFAVLLSSVVALSLCPMMASRILRPEGVRHSGPAAAIGRLGATVYRRTLHAGLDMPFVVVLVTLLLCAAAALTFGTIRQELTPPEDRSVALMRVSAPQGVSLDFTREQTRRIEELVQPLVDSGEVINVFSFAGSGNSTNSAFMVLTLAPWEARARSQDEIVAAINRAVAQVPAVRAFAFQPNSLGIRGAGNGLQFAVVGNDYDELAETADGIVAAMQRDARFGTVEMSYETTRPQIAIAIDRERAADLGIEIDGLGDAIQAMLDGRRVGTVFVRGRAYDVKLVSTTNPVNDPTDLENIFVETGDGRTVPISTIADLTEQPVAPELDRERQLRAVNITASLAPGFALGSALSQAEAIAEPLLRTDMRIVPLAEAATLEENASGMLITFGFAIIVILLVLAAQFESFLSAVIVMATVPVGLACAVFALLLTGTSINVYSQIGLVLLVGIMAKNGILIVEFANQLRDRGLSVRRAIEEAANIRLRPVMMTMISTVLCGVPLALSSGAGAEARAALGWIMVGGLGLAALSTLYLTPVAYLLLARFSGTKAGEAERLARELGEARRLGDGRAPEPAE